MATLAAMMDPRGDLTPCAHCTKHLFLFLVPLLLPLGIGGERRKGGEEQREEERRERKEEGKRRRGGRREEVGRIEVRRREEVEREGKERVERREERNHQTSSTIFISLPRPPFQVLVAPPLA